MRRRAKSKQALAELSVTSLCSFGLAYCYLRIHVLYIDYSAVPEYETGKFGYGYVLKHYEVQYVRTNYLHDVQRAKNGGSWS